MTASALVRRFETTDIDPALILESATYTQPWNQAMFVDELSAPGRTYFVVEVDGRMAGYGGLMVVGDEAHITTLVVAEDARRVGLGSRLMLKLVDAAICQSAKSLTLEVRPSNTRAQALYARFGMAAIGVRKKYYNDEDAVIMWAHNIDDASYVEMLESIRMGLADGDECRVISERGTT